MKLFKREKQKDQDLKRVIELLEKISNDLSSVMDREMGGHQREIYVRTNYRR